MYDITVKADNVLKFRNTDNAIYAKDYLLRKGATQILDKETHQKGGIKYRLDNEVYYIYVSK